MKLFIISCLLFASALAQTGAYMPVTLVADNYISEQSWTIEVDGSVVCSGSGYSGAEGDTFDHTEDCKLAPGTTGTVSCSDSYGDGWGSGYIVIDGTQFCLDGESELFSDSLVETFPDQDCQVDYETISECTFYCERSELRTVLFTQYQRGAGVCEPIIPDCQVGDGACGSDIPAECYTTIFTISDCEGGSGMVSTGQMYKDDTLAIVSIPPGVTNLNIHTVADGDIDFQLVDQTTTKFDTHRCLAGFRCLYNPTYETTPSDNNWITLTYGTEDMQLYFSGDDLWMDENMITEHIMIDRTAVKLVLYVNAYRDCNGNVTFSWDSVDPCAEEEETICTCPVGFDHAGESGCIDIDACASHPCEGQGVTTSCVDLPAPAGDMEAGRECVCDHGYFGIPPNCGPEPTGSPSTAEPTGEPSVSPSIDCSTRTDPCSCVDGCGWSTTNNQCEDASLSTTECSECATLPSCNEGSTCAEFSCPTEYVAENSCQCTDDCADYGNCCADVDTCTPDCESGGYTVLSEDEPERCTEGPASKWNDLGRKNSAEACAEACAALEGCEYAMYNINKSKCTSASGCSSLVDSTNGHHFTIMQMNANVCVEDCEGSWSGCNEQCMRDWQQTQAPNEEGSPCPTYDTAPACNFGDDACACDPQADPYVIIQSQENTNCDSNPVTRYGDLGRHTSVNRCIDACLSTGCAYATYNDNTGRCTSYATCDPTRQTGKSFTIIAGSNPMQCPE